MDVREKKTSHTFIRNALLGVNKIVTYIPCIEELYGEDKDEQVYITRLLQDNLRRMKVIAGKE